MCKRQKTVETAHYGSELVATRMAVELIMEMRYQLRMLGVDLEGPAMLLGDNMSVVLNTTVPSSVLKKKHNAVAYHRVREAITMSVVKFSHISTDDNLADLLTNCLVVSSFTNLLDLHFSEYLWYLRVRILWEKLEHQGWKLPTKWSVTNQVYMYNN